MAENINDTIDFTSVDIEEFYDKEELKDESTDLVILTDDEQELVNTLFDRLKSISPESLEVIANRVADLERLTKNIAHFPSLFVHQTLSAEVRTEHTLLDSLISNRGSDRLLHLPSKAILGKGYIVAKFHVFMSMTKPAKECGFPKEEVAKYQQATLALMYTIMAEDVYLSMLDNDSIPIDLRQQVAYSLLILWEHRSDQNVNELAPVLGKIWHARKALAPAFGTMVGTSELLTLTIQLDEEWRKFISSKLEDKEISMAMEEFLFGLTYEEILRVKNSLKDRGLHAIGREEVAAFLGKTIIQEAMYDLDPRQFYLDYSVRRDNARARLRLNLPGPHTTIEDHYMRFILEKSKEKQHNDVCAK